MNRHRDNTLYTFFREQFLPVRLLGCTPTTVSDYRDKVAVWTRWSGGGTPLEQIDAPLVASFLGGLSQVRAAATVNHYRRVLFAILRYAYRRKYLLSIEWMTDVRRLRERLDDPAVYLLDEVEALIAAARREPGEISGIPARRWWPALLLVIWNCGTRISATMQLRCRDVDLGQRNVELRASTQKQAKTQIFALLDATVAALAAIWCPHRDLLFPWPHDPGRQWPALNRRFRRIITVAGIPQPRQPFHQLRRASGSYLQRGGGDAQRHLGHSSPHTTQRYLSSRVVGGCDPTPYLPALHLGSADPPVNPAWRWD